MSTNTGGTAFPAIRIVSGDNYNPPKQYHMPGMDLRDYFAAKWLTTIVLNPGSNVTPEQVAADCYRVADAMLKERNK